MLQTMKGEPLQHFSIMKTVKTVKTVLLPQFLIINSRLLSIVKSFHKLVARVLPGFPNTIIVFRVSQTLENNKNCLVNSLVNSIVLACLETLVKHQW